MDDQIRSITRRDTWEVVLRKSVTDDNVLTGTWYFRFKRNLIVLSGNSRQAIVL